MIKSCHILVRIFSSRSIASLCMKVVDNIDLSAKITKLVFLRNQNAQPSRKLYISSFVPDDPQVYTIKKPGRRRNRLADVSEWNSLCSCQVKRFAKSNIEFETLLRKMRRDSPAPAVVHWYIKLL
jgi:hypothetical protein